MLAADTRGGCCQLLGYPPGQLHCKQSHATASLWGRNLTRACDTLFAGFLFSGHTYGLVFCLDDATVKMLPSTDDAQLAPYARHTAAPTVDTDVARD